MAWVEVQQSLIRHPKTKKAASLLGIHRLQLVGHVVALWAWAVDYARDGNLGAYNWEEIEEGALWDGQDQALVEALYIAGFLDSDDNAETFRIHDWCEYSGGKLDQLERKKAGNRARQQTFRERHALGNALPKEASQPTSRVSHGLRNAHTGPDPTEPDQDLTEEALPPTPLTPEPALAAPARVSYSAAFEMFWGEWWSGVTKGHGGKKPAYDVWKRLGLDRAGAEVLRNEVVDGLRRWKASAYWQRQGGRFVMHAERWLRDRKWEDDPPADGPARASPSMNGSPPTRSRGENPHRFFALAEQPRQERRS